MDMTSDFTENEPNGGPRVETVNVDCKLLVNEHAWTLVTTAADGRSGVAAYGPIDSLPIIQFMFQAAGGVRRDPSDVLPGSRLVMPDGLNHEQRRDRARRAQRN